MDGTINMMVMMQIMVVRDDVDADRDGDYVNFEGDDKKDGDGDKDDDNVGNDK